MTTPEEQLSCLDCGTTEDVELRTTPDRQDGRHFPRCGTCFTNRLATAERVLELTSPSRPTWFDESYAGERWDED